MNGQISMIDGYEYEPKSPAEIGADKRRLIRPQDQYGLADNDKTCKTCRHLLIRQYGGKYFKCQKWSLSSSMASDIRVSWPACKLYEPEG